MNKHLFEYGRSRIPSHWNLYDVDVTDIIKRIAHGLCNAFSSSDIKHHIAIGDSLIRDLEIDPDMNLTILCIPGLEIHDAFHIFRSFSPNPFVGILLLHVGPCDLSTKSANGVAPTTNPTSKIQKQIQRNVTPFLKVAKQTQRIFGYTTRVGFFSVPERYIPVQFLTHCPEREIDERYSTSVGYLNTCYKGLAKNFDFVFFVNGRTTGKMMAKDGLHLNSTGLKHLSNVFEKAQTEIAAYHLGEKRDGRIAGRII